MAARVSGRRLARGAVLAALTVLSYAVATEIDALAFDAPFMDTNPAGERSIGKFWRVSGAAVVHQNFVRLTPDRQSKKGAVWSTRPTGAHELSASLRFRISGQGKKYFGDGMALWISDARNYRQGDFHGISEKFKGVGLIFDTFKNVEMLAFHKDITVVWNDGATKMEEMLQASVGCNADVRYHEERGDFSIDKSSRVKIVITPKEHSADELETYAKAGTPVPALEARIVKDVEVENEWEVCVQAFTLPAYLDLQWLAKAHLGITASTGQLADNHDILALEVFSDAEKHQDYEKMKDEERWFNVGEGLEPEERFERIEDEVDAIVGRLEHLQHHLEHEMVAVDDHVRTTIEKLQKQEEGAEARIEALEKKVLSNVEDSLSQRISTLEEAMRDAVQQRIKTVEKKYMSELEGVVGDKLKSAGSSWTWPFLFLIVVDIVAAVVVYKWYIKFKKSHLL